MDKVLQKNLREDEVVRWQGTPADFSLLDGVNKRAILLKWIVTVVCAGALLAVYIHQQEAPSGGFIGLVCLIAALIVISPLTERWSLRQQRYWITNQRAILMTRDKSLYYIDLDKLDDFRLIRDQAPEDCLVLGGSIISEPKRQLRWRSCHPKIDMGQTDQSSVQGMVFYCVRDGGTAAELLKEKVRSQKPQAVAV